MNFRKYLLDAAFERITSSMHLRRPQYEALEEFHRLITWLPEPLGTLSPHEMVKKLGEYKPGWTIHPTSPDIAFTLATGVGKSRLLAALIAYLALANESWTFVILAPRRTVLDKFLRELSSTSNRFLFVDPSLVQNMKIWHSDNIAGFRDESQHEGLYEIDPINIFVLSPQALTGEDRRVARVDEFSGVSARDWLKNRDDLIVLSDEAHHFELSDKEEAAWTEAVRQLEPRLHLMFTATPRPGVNDLYTYDLATCLQEKIYTKDVRVIAKERPKTVADETDWDHVTVEFGLKRLAHKRAAAIAAQESGFPKFEPVMLVCCATTAHADETAKWLVEAGHLAADEVIVAHSKSGKTDDAISRLLSVDQPSSKVRVVVTVHQLTEGWDVSNVYVITPLRAMSTFRGAIQTVGRGLRLPAGHRVDDQELDTLDVLTFGRESLDEILSAATTEFGDGSGAGSSIVVADSDASEFERPVPTKAVTSRLLEARTITVPRMRVKQTEPDLDFEPSVAQRLVEMAAQEFSLVARVVKKSDTAVQLPRETFIEMTVQRVVSSLVYLSLPLHGASVGVLVERFLDGSSGQDGGAADMIAHDWRVAGDLLSRQIDAAYRKTATTTFEAAKPSTLELRDQVMHVSDDWVAPREAGTFEWGPTAIRQPIVGWTRCTQEMANFDTRGEFHVATLADRANVDWWMRNDPAQLRIPTPIGFYGPDFVIKRSDADGILLLEIKRADLWESPDSDARIKASAADAYCAEVVSATSENWEHWVVLDEDAKAANSLEELFDLRINLPVNSDASSA